MDCIDLSKRRVWVGAWLPGKRMIELASAANVRPLFRGRRLLNECYQGPPWKGLLCTAICLDVLVEAEGAVERRDALADTSAFLRLRYRAHGLESPPAEELVEDVIEGAVPEEITPERPDLTINYLVSVLQALSEDEELLADEEAFEVAAETLRDLSEATGRRLAEEQYSAEDWAEMSSLWEEAVA